jgi:hypothetical protein
VGRRFGGVVKVVEAVNGVSKLRFVLRYICMPTPNAMHI